MSFSFFPTLLRIMEFATINKNEHETTFVKRWVLSYNISTVDLDPKATENPFPFAFSFLLSVNIPLSVGKRTTTFNRNVITHEKSRPLETNVLISLTGGCQFIISNSVPPPV